MIKLTRILIAVGSVLVLAVVNYAIASKEGIKRSGQTIFLHLAPVDPRSLMQGDYMALRFAIAADIQLSVLKDADGPVPDLASRSRWNEGKIDFASIVLDERGVARLSDTAGAGTLRLRYRIRSQQIWLGTNAFFFEEGSAERYAQARYGEFRLDLQSGEAVLVGLRDADLKLL